jgi:iron complex outermembrane receptor protein
MLKPSAFHYLVERELEIISATKEATSYSSVPRFVRVITREQIDTWGARNLFELLAHFPEFYVYRSNIYLRAVGTLGIKQSYFSEKIQVFLDGIPLADPSNGSSFSSNNNISLNNVKRVEIVYGPMTSLYGVNACLAIINLVTYDSEDIRNVKAGTAINTDNSNDSYFIKSFRGEKFSGIVSFNYREDRGPYEYFTDWMGRKTGLSAYFKHFTYYIKLNIDNGLYLNLYGVDRDNDFPVNVATLVVNGDKSYTKRKAFLNRLGYKIENEAVKFDIYAYFNWFYLKRGYNLCPADFPTCQTTYYSVEERYVKNPGAGAYAIYNSDYGKFTGGIELNVSQLYKYTLSGNFRPSEFNFLSPPQLIPYQELPSSEHLMDTASRTTVSPYFQYQFLKDSAGFLFNFRLDRLSDVGTEKTFSLSFLYRLSDEWNFKLNTGRAVRAPSFEEMYIKNNPILLGNRNLDFEKMDSFMPSVEFLNNNSSMKLLFYVYRLKDLIYRATVTAAGQQKWVNADENVFVRGITADLRKRLHNFEVYGGVNRIFSISNLRDTTFLAFPRWKTNGGITYYRSKLMLDFNFEGYSEITDNDIRRVPGYGVLNCNLTYKVMEHVKLSLRIDNLFDREIIYPVYKDIAPREPAGMVGEGRNLWLSVEYSF